jgi:MFS transporter, SP family, inositol transporter
VGGWLCDRYGRKFIYTYDLVVYMAGVLVAACAVSYLMLLVGFLLTGLAVGAGVPASWTYIAEEAPSDARARHVGTAQLPWSIGPVVGFALAIAVVPLGLLGNRLVFAHLFVVAFVTWWLRQGLHESTAWTAQRSRQDTGPGHGSLRGLLSHRRNVTALLFLFGVYGFWNLVAGQAGIFRPRVYQTAGLSDPAEQNALQVLVWGCTALATWWGFMRLADRSTGARCTPSAACSVWWRGRCCPMPAARSGCCWPSPSPGASPPGSARRPSTASGPVSCSRPGTGPTAQGVLFFSARVAVGLLSYVFPTLLAARGVPFVGTILLAFLLLALVIGTVWAPSTQGRSLDQIADERLERQPV